MDRNCSRLDEIEGLMSIGKTIASIGLLISFVLFLVIQKNFDASYSGISLIIGYIGMGLFVSGLSVFLISVGLRNDCSHN
jgi:hypothetical protein